ncbi:hypothetical protein R1sor_021108 [Riccia sorocarpa]|uniref:DUF4283 domain-containing protein n=1 Tax=Riccia sorocarpa TaxID=122646 RepID=A0ABD3GG40_9MARC
MASAKSQSSMGGKTFQGAKVAAAGAPSHPGAAAQGISQGQVAQLRTVGAPLAPQYDITSPTKNQMDYRAAVSPAKGPGSYSNQQDPSGHQYRGLMVPYNLQINGTSYNDDVNYGDPTEEKETEEEDQQAPSNHEQQTSPLHDILEADEDDPEEDDTEDTRREASYIDRNSAWVDVLDENLQKTRKNPAAKEASANFEIDMGDLLSAVEDIIETTDCEEKIATDALQLDSRLFAEGIKQLQQNSLVIHTVDLRVNMAYFERWAEVTLHQLLGVTIISICQLDPFCFHVVVDSGNAKAHIFANSPLKMGNKMVFPLPWDTRFTTRDLKSRAVPVWLELYNVHPGLMKFGLNMLRKVGPIIYAAKNTETQRINIVRGCILMDLSKPLPDFIPITVPEAPRKIMQQRIRYLQLPDACFMWRQTRTFCTIMSTQRQQGGATAGGSKKRSAKDEPGYQQRR